MATFRSLVIGYPSLQLQVVIARYIIMCNFQSHSSITSPVISLPLCGHDAILLNLWLVLCIQR